MSRQWTEEQRAAIQGREEHLLVSAAAGSGKTAVLVERIIRLTTDPEEPLDIDRLLVVTFTNAAAGEMRQRMGERLADLLRQQPGNRLLQRQLSLLNMAAVTTLHSFCLDLLRQHFQHLDLDPAFRVADESEGKMLQADVMEGVFEAGYTDGHSEFLHLVDRYGGERSDSRLQQLVYSLYFFSRSQPDPAGWLRAAVAALRQEEPSLDGFPWSVGLRQHIRRQLAGAVAQLEKARQAAGQPGGPSGYLPLLEKELVQLRGLSAGPEKPWDVLAEQINGLEWGRLPRCSADVDDQIKVLATRYRDGAKKTVRKISGQFFSRSAAQHLADLDRAAFDLQALVELTLQFEQSFRQAKLQRGLVDFNDLEHYALRLLEDPEAGVAAALRERFCAVLVDEYQDINQVQETILEKVSGNRFMVGDVKQSIYRFRQAEPGLFLKKYREFHPAEGAACRKISLAKNFRSRPEVIDGVNFVFRQLMTPVLGEIGYDGAAELVCGRGGSSEGQGREGTAIELHLLERTVTGSAGEEDFPEREEPGPAMADAESDSGDSDSMADDQEGEYSEADLTVAQREAQLTAGRIRQLMDPAQPFRIGDGDACRPVRYRDMVILLRAAKGWAETFSQELQLAGIPVYADSAGGYFEAAEVENMLSLLRIVDNPRQDIFLAGVLRSPLADFTLEDLTRLRLHSQGGDLFQALLDWPEETTELASKVQGFLARLEDWRTQARRGRLADLIWAVYRDTGYFAFVGAMPGGGQRQANLRALYDRARQYEATSFRGLFRFLRFIDRLRGGGSDLGTARSLGENEDVVRIISVHKSKGLEFPVVFLPGLGKKFNFQDLSGDLLLHRDLGIGSDVADMETRVVWPAISKLAIRSRLEMESLAEEMRIFYVAMTRARDKLVLIGSGKNLSRQAGGWADSLSAHQWYLPDFQLAGDRTWLDWLGRCLIRHRDGRLLRQLAGVGEDPLDNPGCNREFADFPGCWQVSLCPAGAQPLLETRIPPDMAGADLAALAEKGETVPVSGRWTGEVNRRMGWTYPGAVYLHKAAKVSVTRLAREAAAEEAVPPTGGEAAALPIRRPLFLQEKKGLNAAERGTALHLAMQHLDFQAAVDPGQIQDQLAAMVRRQVLSPQQAAAVPLPAVQSFLNSPLGHRLRLATACRREVPFTLALEGAEVYPDLPAGPEKVLVQGVIDLLFQEGEGWVIVDYKTGHDGRPDGDLKQEFTAQLELYARAVATIWGIPVREKYLYLFADCRLLQLD